MMMTTRVVVVVVTMATNIMLQLMQANMVHFQLLIDLEQRISNLLKLTVYENRNDPVMFIKLMEKYAEVSFQ